MVALSVSTSQSTSSDFTASPTFLFHETIFPSVIVSLKSGILISLAPAGNSTFAVLVLLVSVFGAVSLVIVAADAAVFSKRLL